MEEQDIRKDYKSKGRDREDVDTITEGKGSREEYVTLINPDVKRTDEMNRTFMLQTKEQAHTLDNKLDKKKSDHYHK